MEIREGLRWRVSDNPHCVMAYRVALMAVTGQAERFGSAGLA
jgi:hypothetical protein